MGLTLKAREMSSMSTSMFEAHSATKATWASGTNCRRPISGSPDTLSTNLMVCLPKDPYSKMKSFFDDM